MAAASATAVAGVMRRRRACSRSGNADCPDRQDPFPSSRHRMKILLTGATGFIGSRLLLALRSRGHDVIGVARRAPAAGGERWIAVDFATARTADWLPHLAGVDAV